MFEILDLADHRVPTGWRDSPDVQRLLAEGCCIVWDADDCRVRLMRFSEQLESVVVDRALQPHYTTHPVPHSRNEVIHCQEN